MTGDRMFKENEGGRHVRGMRDSAEVVQDKVEQDT